MRERERTLVFGFGVNQPRSFLFFLFFFFSPFVFIGFLTARRKIENTIAVPVRAEDKTSDDTLGACGTLPRDYPRSN